MFIAVDGRLELFCAGSSKLVTTSTGVSVTGNIDLPSNGAILFDNTSNIEQYYIRNGGSSQSSLQIGKGTPGSDIKFSLDDAGNASFASSVTFSNGQINLGSGTGRIQGVDTVSANTDAANKLYVDNAIAGVPQGDITGVTAGDGMTGGGTSGTVTLNVVGGDGITANANDIEITPAQTTITSIYYDGLDIGGASGVNEIDFWASKIAFTASSTSV